MLLKKAIDEDDLLANCNIISLLLDKNLMHFVQNIGPYSPWLTLEFYANLTADTTTIISTIFHQVFVHDKWYSFSPEEINNFFNRTTLCHAFEADLDL